MPSNQLTSTLFPKERDGKHRVNSYCQQSFFHFLVRCWQTFVALDRRGWFLSRPRYLLQLFSHDRYFIRHEYNHFNFKKANLYQLYDDLLSINWSFLRDLHDINEACSKFYEVLCSTSKRSWFDCSVPW